MWCHPWMVWKCIMDFAAIPLWLFLYIRVIRNVTRHKHTTTEINEKKKMYWIPDVVLRAFTLWDLPFPQSNRLKSWHTSMYAWKFWMDAMVPCIGAVIVKASVQNICMVFHRMPTYKNRLQCAFEIIDFWTCTSLSDGIMWFGCANLYPAMWRYMGLHR